MPGSEGSTGRPARIGAAAILAALGVLTTDAVLALVRTGLEPLGSSETLRSLQLVLAIGWAPSLALGACAAGATPWIARAGRRRVSIVAGVLVAVAALSLALREQQVDWTTVDSRIAWLPVAAGVAGGLGWALRVRKLNRFAAGVGALGILAGVAYALGREPAAGIERIRSDTWLVAPEVGLVAHAFDRDDDGHASRLCGEGCDCDDADASRHPTGIETAADGIDQDCDGEDLSTDDEHEFARMFGPPPTTGTDVGSPVVAPRPDIVLITIDTLRVDHLGVYGYERDTSPNIDAWAAGAVVFDQARSTGPSTRFSIPPLMIGKYFTEIARSRAEWPSIAETETLLAERLAELGYVSAAFHSIRYLRPQYGLNQGFHHYSVDCLDQRGPPLRMTCADFITDEALAWLDARGDKPDQPLLLWAYYGDPHSQYMRHPGYPSFGSNYVDAYDDEIAFVDHHVGRLLAGIAARRPGIPVVVLHSDHGEGLDEALDHGSKQHSRNLYDELVRVPLIVSGAGFPARRVATPVSLVDFVPTVLDLLGQPADEQLRGVSLLAWLRGETTTHPPVMFEKHRALDDAQHGMVAWPYKVIRTLPSGRTRIFDLSRDPGEQRDVVGSLSDEERRRLVGALVHWHGKVRRPFDDGLRH